MKKEKTIIIPITCPEYWITLFFFTVPMIDSAKAARAVINRIVSKAMQFVFHLAFKHAFPV